MSKRTLGVLAIAILVLLGISMMLTNAALEDSKVEKAALKKQVKRLEANQEAMIEMINGINRNLNNVGIYGPKISKKVTKKG